MRQAFAFMEFKEEDVYRCCLLSPFYGVQMIVFPTLGPLSFLIGISLVGLSPILVPGAILWAPYMTIKYYRLYLRCFEQNEERVVNARQGVSQEEIDRTNQASRNCGGRSPYANPLGHRPRSLFRWLIG